MQLYFSLHRAATCGVEGWEDPDWLSEECGPVWYVENSIPGSQLSHQMFDTLKCTNAYCLSSPSSWLLLSPPPGSSSPFPGSTFPSSPLPLPPSPLSFPPLSSSFFSPPPHSYSPSPPPHPYSPSPPSTANLLLQDTVERIHVGKQYGDIPRGIYLVRGENVALCGEIVSQYIAGGILIQE